MAEIAFVLKSHNIPITISHLVKGYIKMEECKAKMILPADIKHLCLLFYYFCRSETFKNPQPDNLCFIGNNGTVCEFQTNRSYYQKYCSVRGDVVIEANQNMQHFWTFRLFRYDPFQHTLHIGIKQISGRKKKKRYKHHISAEYINNNIINMKVDFTTSDPTNGQLLFQTQNNAYKRVMDVKKLKIKYALNVHVQNIGACLNLTVLEYKQTY